MKNLLSLLLRRTRRYDLEEKLRRRTREMRKEKTKMERRELDRNEGNEERERRNERRNRQLKVEMRSTTWLQLVKISPES